MDWSRYEQLGALERSGNFKDALDGYRQLKTDCTDRRDKVVLLLAIVNCLLLLGRTSEAKQSIREAFTLVENDMKFYPRVAFKDATIDIELKDWKAALGKMERLLKDYPDALSDPDNSDVVEHLNRSRGFALTELNRFREAKPLLEEVSSKEFHQGPVLCYLGACNYELGDLEASEKNYSDALAVGLDPSYECSAHYGLGTIYLRQGKLAWANQQFEKCLEQQKWGRVPKRDVVVSLLRTAKGLGSEDQIELYTKMLDEI